MGFRFTPRVGPFSYSMGPAGCLVMVAGLGVMYVFGAILLMLLNPLYAVLFGGGVLLMGFVVLGAIASDRRHKRKAAEQAARQAVEYRPPHWR